MANPLRNEVMLAMSTGEWIGAGMFASGVLITLYAFGWLPASLAEGHHDPAMKKLKWIGPLSAVIGFLKFLFASAT